MAYWCFALLFLVTTSLADTQPTLQEVLDRLHFIETRLSKSDKEIFELREVTTIQNDVINQQAQQIKKLEHDVERLNGVVASNTMKLITNAKHVKFLRKQFKQLLLSRFTQNDEQQTEVHSESIKTSHISKTKSVQQKRPNRQVAGGVAFTAYLDHDVNFGALQTIVVTNEGNGYNLHTGVFTCPEDGVYFFTFSVGQRSDTEGIKQLWADLVVNRQNIIDAVAETKYATQDDQGSNSAVKRLNQGDTVWVRSRYAGHHAEGSGFRITSFTGMYLYS